MPSLLPLDTAETIRELTHRRVWWDPDAECTVMMSRPHLDEDLWEQYLGCAQRSYRRHGVEEALALDSFRDGQDTALFWTVHDPAGRLVGGVRAKGPLTGAYDSHAALEWDRQPGHAAVCKMIEDRVPFGVTEIKSAFTIGDPALSKVVTRILARAPILAMAALNLQFSMATSAAHVLEMWRSSGGVVAAIPATPYPSPRYRTKMMWWDRRTYTQHAEPEQVSRIRYEVTEMEDVRPESYELAGLA